MAQKATLAIASGTLALMLGFVSVGARPAPPPPLLDPVAAIVEAFDTHDLVAITVAPKAVGILQRRVEHLAVDAVKVTQPVGYRP